MPSASKRHTYAPHQFVVLVSGKIILISTRLSKPPAEVLLATLRNQSWYAGHDAIGLRHTFPESAVTRTTTGFDPLSVPPSQSIPRTLANEVVRRRKAPVATPQAQTVYSGIELEWNPVQQSAAADAQEATREAQKVTQFLLNTVPAAITAKVFDNLLTYARERRPDLLPAAMKKSIAGVLAPS